MLYSERFFVSAAVTAALLLGSVSAAAAFTACEVTDTGGIDDNSFNQTAWKGVLDAKEKLGVEARYLESQAETDYEANINSLLGGQCDIIITVGFLLGDDDQKGRRGKSESEVFDRRLFVRSATQQCGGPGLLHR